MPHKKKLARLINVTVFPGSFGFHGSAARVAKANDALSKAWEAVQALHGTDSEEAARKLWQAYQRAVVKLVREYKQALYCSAHVRRCIDHAILSGDKRFFADLDNVLPAGVGLDRRIEKQLALARKAYRLHRQGHTWSQTADLLDPEFTQGIDSEAIRILVRRYKKHGLL